MAAWSRGIPYVPLLFPYFVRQKEYFHLFPLSVGNFVPSLFILSCCFPCFIILTCLISVYLKPVKFSCYFVFKHNCRFVHSKLWYKINLTSVDNSLIIYSLRSKVLVERSQCLLAQTHHTLTRSPITFSVRQGWHWRQKYWRNWWHIICRYLPNTRLQS